MFDVDDTLYSHKIKAVPTLTLRALDELKEKGIKIGINTARIVGEMYSFPQELFSRADCVVMDTGAVAFVKDKYYKTYGFGEDEVKKYTDYLNSHNISYNYSDINGDTYFYGDKSLIEVSGALRFTNGDIKYKEYEDEEITNIFFYNASDSQAEEIKNIDPSKQIAWWGTSGNISAELVDKSFGLLKFCEIFHFTTDEVMAFGDGTSDDLLLDMAGVGVAVKDSKPEVLAVADHVCNKSIEDGGIYEALIELGILDKKKYEPKIFFFDCDSTLYCHFDDKVPESVYDALNQLKAKGYKLCLNTSRSYDEMYNVPKKLMDMMDDLNLLAGAYCIHPDGKEIHYLDDDVVKKLIDLFDKYDLTYRYCTDDGGGYLNRIDEYANLFKTLYDMIPPAKKYEGEKVISILFYCDRNLQHEIAKEIPDACFAFLSRGVEVSPKGIDKASSLISTSKHYGFELKDTCAFGDGGNDITMLQTAGLGICLGNGTNEAKQAADYITDATNKDGIYKAMKYFGFVK